MAFVMSKSYERHAGDGNRVTRMDEIKDTVISLLADEYRQLRNWFRERDWAQCDKQIQSDSESRKLDFLVKGAMHVKSRGKLRGL
jgi:hypothetical protein